MEYIFSDLHFRCTHSESSWSAQYCCLILTQTETCYQIFVKLPSTTCHNSHSVPLSCYKWTDGQPRHGIAQRHIFAVFVPTSHKHVREWQRVCFNTEMVADPWCKDLLNKIIIPQLIKKFTFYGTQQPITFLWPELDQFTLCLHHLPNPISWRNKFTLTYHLCLDLPSGIIPSQFPTQTCSRNYILITYIFTYRQT